MVGRLCSVLLLLCTVVTGKIRWRLLDQRSLRDQKRKWINGGWLHEMLYTRCWVSRRQKVMYGNGKEMVGMCCSCEIMMKMRHVLWSGWICMINIIGNGRCMSEKLLLEESGKWYEVCCVDLQPDWGLHFLSFLIFDLFYLILIWERHRLSSGAVDADWFVEKWLCMLHWAVCGECNKCKFFFHLFWFIYFYFSWFSLDIREICG